MQAIGDSCVTVRSPVAWCLTCARIQRFDAQISQWLHTRTHTHTHTNPPMHSETNKETNSKTDNADHNGNGEAVNLPAAGNQTKAADPALAAGKPDAPPPPQRIHHARVAEGKCSACAAAKVEASPRCSFRCGTFLRVKPQRLSKAAK